jgi:hypothetical protein
MARERRWNIDYEPDSKRHNFKDIEFFREDADRVRVIFTPMGCHNKHCQTEWLWTRKDFNEMRDVLSPEHQSDEK